ncbi:MAG TPA: DUF4136 domain-containing protein [Rhizobacter sp.]|nr:DUF4136 domain-containing protein [Rhizobacter sp.]
MRWLSAVVLGLAATLSGCAALNTVDSEVSTFSQWPEGRKPGTFAFERLPSQQVRPQEQEQLESIARTALYSAGFQEAGDPKQADVTVLLGLRISRTDPYPYYYDPLWWRGGFYYPYPRVARPYWGPGFWGPWSWGPAYPMMYDSPRYDREVAVLLRDRQSNQPLYEARAASDGLNSGSDRLMAAMFMAAMKDFPSSGANPRRISIQLPE